MLLLNESLLDVRGYVALTAPPVVSALLLVKVLPLRVAVSVALIAPPMAPVPVTVLPPKSLLLMVTGLLLLIAPPSEEALLPKRLALTVSAWALLEASMAPPQPPPELFVKLQ